MTLNLCELYIRRPTISEGSTISLAPVSTILLSIHSLRQWHPGMTRRRVCKVFSPWYPLPSTCRMVKRNDNLKLVKITFVIIIVISLSTVVLWGSFSLRRNQLRKGPRKLPYMFGPNIPREFGLKSPKMDKTGYVLSIKGNKWPRNKPNQRLLM